MVDLGDGGDGGFAAAACDALLDGDAGREAFDRVHIGLFELIDELAGVGRHAVEEAALAFGEEDVEGQGRFARAAEAGDDDHAVARDVDVDVLEVVLAGASDGDGVRAGEDLGERGFFAEDGRSGVALEERSEELGGAGFGGFEDFFGGSSGDNFSALVAAFGAEVDDPVGTFHDLEVVLDDNDAVSLVHEAVEDFDEKGDIVEVEAGGGFVEDEKGLFAGLADEVVDELEALGLAAGEGIHGLAELEVVEADFGEEAQRAGDFSRLVEGLEKFHGLGGGEFEDFVDGFSGDLDFQQRWAEAGAVAFGAAEKEVAEKLHFDLFETEAAAAVAASIAGVEGKARGREAGGLGGGGVAEKSADVVVDAEVDGWRGARGFRERGLVDHHDFIHFLVAVDGFDEARGFLFGRVLADQLAVEDIADEGGFART